MRLTGKQIAILLAEGVEDLEYYVPLMRLQEEGAEVISAAIDLKPLRGKNGLEIMPSTRIESFGSSDLFAVVTNGAS
jgi:protease I